MADMEDKEKVIPAEEGSVTGEEESDALKRAEEALAELEKKVSARTVALEWLKDILIAFVIAVVVLQFIKPTVVKQRSMEPNFYTNDYLFVSRQSYKLLGGDPERGDVIVFRSDLVTEDGRTKLLIKRVIGLPGARVEIHDGKVFVNGEAIDDSYTMDQFTAGTMDEITVPEDSLFCMGDNRTVSVDSRSSKVGCVPYDAIMGKVVFRLLPFKNIGVIKNPYKE